MYMVECIKKLNHEFPRWGNQTNTMKIKADTYFSCEVHVRPYDLQSLVAIGLNTCRLSD